MQISHVALAVSPCFQYSIIHTHSFVENRSNRESSQPYTENVLIQ
jgi:hypothetical protein